MNKQQQAPAADKAQEEVAQNLDRVSRFLDYQRECASRGGRSDDAQLAALNMARTPCRVLFQENAARVLDYEILGTPVDAPPIYIIYSFINRWYILDLQPGHSFIEALSKAGFKVYCLDWGVPGPEHAQLGLDYHLEQVALRGARRVSRAHGGQPITLFGYCLGGTLAAMMAALHPELYRNLVLLTTPLAFENAGLLSLWTNKEYFNPEKLADAFGCVPEQILHAPFPFLQTRAQMAKPRTLYENILNDEFLKNYRPIDRWATDNIPFPGRCFHEIIKGCYQEDQLVKGTMTIGGKPVRLEAITAPTLNVFAKQDHVVPLETARANRRLLSSATVTDREYDSGHVTLTVSHPIRHQVWGETISWLHQNAHAKN